MNAIVKPDMTVTPEFLAGRGYTITKAAHAVGVSPAHLCFVLKGERKPSKELVRKLKHLPKYHPIKPRVSYATR